MEKKISAFVLHPPSSIFDFSCGRTERHRMSQLTIIVIFVAALLVTLIRGAGWAFVLVYLPAMILFNQVKEIPLAHAPVFKRPCVRARFTPFSSALPNSAANPLRSSGVRSIPSSFC